MIKGDKVIFIPRLLDRVWLTPYTRTITTTHTGLSGITYVVKIPSARLIGNPPSTVARVTFKGAPAVGLGGMNAAWIGNAAVAVSGQAAPAPATFDGNQAQLTFNNGSASYLAIDQNEIFVSDIISFSRIPGRPLLIAINNVANGVGNSHIGGSPSAGTGIVTYYKTGVQIAHQTVKAGFTSFESSLSILKIELGQ